MGSYTGQIDSNFNKFNNETSTLEFWLQKQNQVILIHSVFYLNFKATTLIYNLGFSKTGKMLDSFADTRQFDRNSIVFVLNPNFCVEESLIQAPLYQSFARNSTEINFAL